MPWYFAEIRFRTPCVREAEKEVYALPSLARCAAQVSTRALGDDFLMISIQAPRAWNAILADEALAALERVDPFGCCFVQLMFEDRREYATFGNEDGQGTATAEDCRRFLQPDVAIAKKMVEGER